MPVGPHGGLPSFHPGHLVRSGFRRNGGTCRPGSRRR
jgi:hypothetical protein